MLWKWHANLSTWGNQDSLQWLEQRTKRTDSNQTTSSTFRLYFQKVRFQFISLLVYFLCISSLPHSDHKDKHDRKLAEQEQIFKKKKMIKAHQGLFHQGSEKSFKKATNKRNKVLWEKENNTLKQKLMFNHKERIVIWNNCKTNSRNYSYGTWFR